MPRAGQVRASDDRLTDWVGIGVLTKSFPPGLVDEVVAACGRTEQRSRLLPARVVVYFVLALALYSSGGYDEVMRRLVGGLAWVSRFQDRWQVPSSPALSKARARLGSEPMARLFDRVCTVLGDSSTPGVFYRSWRLVSIDGTVLNVADTPANDERFARPVGSHGPGAFPQVRILAAAESGTHGVFAAVFDGVLTSEQELLRRITGSFSAGMLVIADRNFLGFDLWATAADTGADLLWRAKSTNILAPTQILADGSYLSQLRQDHRRASLQRTVRVIEYVLDNDPKSTFRLVTTILDPDAAPAIDLANAYIQRWEIESVFTEIKTYQLDARPVLRSRDPNGVAQEIWGILCVHHALRDLIHHTAEHEHLDPDRISFTQTLNSARRADGGLSPLPLPTTNSH